MKIILKTERDLEAMRPACGVARVVLDEVGEMIQPGITTREIDEFAGERIRSYGAKSAFLGYRGYPCNICISVNDEVVHGIAGDRRLNFGDIVSIDVGVLYNGFIGDNAKTVPVGGCDAATQSLLDVTQQSLDWYRTVNDRIRNGPPNPLGVHILLGHEFAKMSALMMQNLAERRVKVIMGTAKIQDEEEPAAEEPAF